MTEAHGPAAGDKAPDAPYRALDGSEARISDHFGKPLVLYFYPKDDTPGCTTEARGFSEQADAFAQAGATVLGVSRDSVKKHGNFVRKYDLRIPLASDESGAVCEAYGVWVEKSMYGRSYMGIERATFLIDADGRVAQAWRKVKVPGHVDAVLAAVSALR
jgi:peroxiredoxin Q/BCP